MEGLTGYIITGIVSLVVGMLIMRLQPKAKLVRESDSEITQEVTHALLRKLVLDNNSETKQKFLEEWSEEIDHAVEAIAAAHAALDGFRKDSGVEGNLRSATVEMFLHSAVYSLVASSHHLVSGYPVSAGHMMRHFYESFAMAALCADPPSQVLEAFTADRGRYRVDTAPSKLLSPKVSARLEQSLGFDQEAWAAHLKKNTDFGKRSHATGLTLAFQAMLDSDDAVVLGGQYDPAKAKAYRADLGRIKTAGESLAELGIAVTKTLSVDAG